MEEEAVEDYIYITEEQAQPEDGMESFYSFLKKNLRYPAEALEKEVEGKVYIQFVIEKDGSLTDIKVAKGIGAGCDEEAIRVMKYSPKWNAGKQRGRPVRQRMVIPIIFKLG